MARAVVQTAREEWAHSPRTADAKLIDLARPEEACHSSTGSSPSPASKNSPLVLVIRGPEKRNSSKGASFSPRRYPVDLARSTSASKGGCWTCRLRRKKCDENREGDSCHTCIRLTIQCLGWGPKRPEWMRDKQAVETYKEEIKTQLIRAGLIRGQPRWLGLSPMARPPSHVHDESVWESYPPEHHRYASSSASSLLRIDSVDLSHQYGQPRHSMLPPTPGKLTGAALRDPGGSPGGFNTTMFTPQYDSLVSSSIHASTEIQPLDFDFAQLGADGFDFAVRAPSPEQALPMFAGHSLLQENHCIYYFEHVRKMQYIFAGNTVTNVTCSMIVQEPRGAVTNAVCALASLHYTRMRVAQGLEAPETSSEQSTARYFYDEAYHQLVNAKQLHGTYSESDAVAALHLVYFSQLSGGATDWQPVLAVACDWVAQQTDLLKHENPQLALQSLSVEGQLIVNLTLWLDIFSSLTTMHPPKYIGLHKRLFGDSASWELASGGPEIRINALTGWPEEVLLGIAEVSELSHWKAVEKPQGPLSNRDLIRRGTEIEQQLRKASSAPACRVEVDKTPLHPKLLQADSEVANATPSNEARQVVARIFSETAILYLHTVLGDSNPNVPEISDSVEIIVQLLGQLPASELDQALVFPICLAGCMTDNPSRRDLLKGRLQGLNERFGNSMRTWLLMEAVWQKRDVSGTTVDWRETMRQRGLNLLLV
ncbi:fungal-specific transcription factor domain-containing protein [Mycena vitilis]|nr:fungal-specific transcription factor domain-containing protein [Mycena vitilis]